MALLSLVLLPAVFRGGADTPHDHSLLQLLIDASDGVIDHHHPAGLAAAPVAATSRFDPAVTDVADPGAGSASQLPMDDGDQQNSAPATSAIDLMPAILAMPPIDAVSRQIGLEPPRPLAGCPPRVPFPPPRRAATPA